MSPETNQAIALFALASVFGIFIFGFGIIAGWNMRDKQDRRTRANARDIVN